MSGGIGRVLREPKDVVAALRLLVLVGLAMLGLGEPPLHRAPFWLVTCVYGATNIGYLLSRSEVFRTARTQAVVFLFDVAIVSLLIVLRGSQVPQFILAYFTLTLTAAVVQGLGSAITNALFVGALYAAVTLWGRDPSELLTFPILSQFAFFLVIAVFMGHVAETARQEARERMRASALAEALETAVAERTQDLTRSVAELGDARSRLRASERMSTIGMLAAGVAHDIRSPIAALGAALEEAGDLVGLDVEIATDERQRLRAAILDAQEACGHLHTLALDLTGMARRVRGEPRAVDPGEAVRGVGRLLRHRAVGGTSIEVLAHATRPVLADPARLQQMLVNLAANGLDAMETRPGVLTLATEDTPDGRVRFAVADRGVGMPEALRLRLFEPFLTTKVAGRGTGLGLHIVQEIAREHGGSISVESTVGEGTRFAVDLPSAQDPTVHVSAEAHAHVPDPPDPAADHRRRGEHPSCVGAHAPA